MADDAVEPFLCPRCGAVSYNPRDAQERYCGRCHAFVEDTGAAGIACWFCPRCATLTLLRLALADHCCQTPRRADCPLPFPSVTQAEIAALR